MSSSSRFLMILSPSSPLLLHHRRPTSSLLRLTRHRMQLSFFRQHHFPPPCPLQPSTRNKKDSSSFLPRPSPRHFHARTASSNFANSSVLTPSNHPWPEFSNLLNNISAAGYLNSSHTSNELAADASLFPEEFLVVLNACLAFARDKPDLLRLLSRKEIEAVVFNGKPFLFKDGEETARRLMVFLNSGESNVADGDKANTFDLMRFLLSYASNVTFSSDRTSLYNTELVESSVRHLLGELAKLSASQPVSNYSEHDPNRQMARSFGPNIEMKRGDWICPRCNFMNFARNVKCLECEEARPKRQLTGGEWECPQCDFFNYGRNTVCLRCDCKRPGQISLGNAYSRPGLAYSNETSSNKADLDRRLAANEEKAQRWFSKVSQLEGTDMSSATADEDFPEIMPLRRGVNRFVVSTRKSPLERRLADAQYRRNMDNDGIPERNNFQTGEVNKTPGAKVSRSLDEVLGRSPSTSGSSDGSINTGVENSPVSTTMQDGHPIGTKSNYVPFVPLPADMFAKKPENFEVHDSLKAVSNDHKTVASNTVGQMDAVSGRKDLQESLQSQQHSEKESIDREVEQAEKSERWFKKVAELHNVTDLATAIPDEDFPEIMPMRKGENKFVVSRNKDRSLTSPTYKRRVATEQASNTNYVPFVPFPPDYFAKKDKPQANGADSSAKAAGEPSTYLTPGKPSDKLSEMSVSDDMQPMQNQQMQSWSLKPSGDTADRTQTGGYSNPKSINPQTSNIDSRKHATDSLGSSPPQSGYQNVSSSWSGKSLEGSAVKEPDPLDMSEEAKAERWFRRVAQIKDISELSQIPDEDFPSIMPMRKGVNRFVVSKRKTPLERRLTSQQYRRNLPDPGKEETDSNSN